MDEIRVRVPLSEVIGGRMKLTRAGHEFKGCCPFHREKSPSFTVNDQKGFYHCFGCGAHGDVIGFLMQHDNVGFRDAVEDLAARAGLQVPQQTPEDIQKYERRSDLYSLVDETSRWFEAQLQEAGNARALAYLKDRGLDNETLATFRVGYAPEDTDSLFNYLKQKGYKASDMVEAGVVRDSTYAGKSPYSFFRGRIIFPVADMRGRVVAFGGRILPDDYAISQGHTNRSGHTPPKYINSSETPLFHKGHMLYAQALARQALGKGATPLVVEGYMDVIALAQAGVQGAVAPLGTALTENQVETLWKMAPEDNRIPVLCFDGDKAGRRAASRSVERILPLLKPDHSVRIAFLPDGEDPDSLVQKSGKAAMDVVIEKSISLMDMLWEEESKARRLDTPEAKAGLQAALEKRVSVVPDRTVQNFYLAEIKKRIYEAFRTKYQGRKGGFKRPENNESIRPSHVKMSAVRKQKHRIEHILLAAMLNYPTLFAEFGETLGMLSIQDTIIDHFRQKLLNILEDVDRITSDSLKDMLVEQGYQSFLDELLCESLYVRAAFTRPEQEIDFVREGWQYTWERSLTQTQTGA